jgi:hypothetical protein
VTRTRLLELVVLGLLIALGTWHGGWWVIPPVAAVWQLIRRREPAWLVALAAALGWAALLLVLPLGALDRLDGRLSRLVYLPPVGATGITLGYAALLGWSAARIVRALRG